MHTELIEDLVDEVRTVVLKLDRIACALERLHAERDGQLQTRGRQMEREATRPLNHWTYGSQIERGRAE